MKLTELMHAYWRLWFPRVPQRIDADDQSFVSSFIKEHAQGNISLQAGRFLTRTSHDKLIQELEGHRFSV